MKQLLVSVVVTTKNEQGVLGELLSSIGGQGYKKVEIIVVDNRSSDKTREIAKKFTSRVYTGGPERSAQRNLGVDKATGEYVFILDADMVLEKNVIGGCVRLAEEQNLKAIIVPEKSFGKGFWTQFKVFEREFYENDEDIEAPRFFKKAFFKEFGGYDLTITGPEDWDLPLRMRKAGGRFGRIKSYILHNERNFSPWRSAKKKFYYASGAREHLRRHPEMVFTQGNLLLRPVFFKKWRKLVAHPFLALGMFFIRALEMTGALLGVLYFLIGKK